MESPVHQWDFVVKVKYGETLKRFNAYVHGDIVDHNMSRLRKRIINLFKLNPEAELVLTYVDQDGDSVALDDDDELHDAAIKQRLNPLRIIAQLKSDTRGSPDLRQETVNSATAVPQREHNQHPEIASVIEEVLRHVPEPFQSSFSEISGDIISRAISAPAVADIMDFLAKLGLSNVSQSGNKSGAPSQARTQPNDLNINDQPEASDASAPVSTQLSDPVPEQLPQQHESVNKAKVDIDHSPTYVGLYTSNNAPIPEQAPEHPPVDDLLSVWISNEIADLQKQNGSVDHKEKSAAASPPFFQPVPTNMEQHQSYIPSSVPAPAYGFSGTIAGDKHISHRAAPSGTLNDVNSMGSKQNTDLPFPNGSHASSHQSDDFSRNDTALGTFHRGIRCDGCGMRPIVGPRFKSKVKEDYDLCYICFSEMGNKDDYTRIDIVYPQLIRVRNNDTAIPHHWWQQPLPHHCGRSWRTKLESLFIKDVTVLDGTLIPPSTPFTKIWRMRNNGHNRWPYGTRLVWVGGDQFGNRGSVLVEVPVDGLPVNEEIDIAIDFVSPSLPGSYFSYWRLSSPAGGSFGQTVWVLIQVDDNSRENSPSSFNANLNLNLPPESSNRDGFRMIDVNAEPFDDPALEAALYNNPVELVEPSGNQIPKDGADPATNDDGIAKPTEVSSPVSYPIIDLAPSEHESSAVVPPATAPMSEKLDMEEKMLKELEEMGFKQIDLNKEVLRLNKYDFEQSLDDLCGYSEWDPLLKELEEMGFLDRTKNKKLLIKHGGSIKRVVLDLLIPGDKD